MICVRVLALLPLLAGMMLGQLRHGNFDLQFDPVAVLQTGARIPFRIVVNDQRQQPLVDATVTLQIETADHTNVQVLKASAIDKGVYMAKPEFSAPGRWEVLVQVQRGEGFTSRSKEYNVPRTAE